MGEHQSRQKSLNLCVKDIQESSSYKEFEDVALRNSEGSALLVGGRVYRLLARIAHGLEVRTTDVDFLVARLRKPLDLPMKLVTLTYWDGYGECEYQRYEYVQKVTFDLKKANSCGVRIEGIHNTNGALDLIDLSKLGGWKRIFRPKPTLEDYFANVPLTVQAIGYDLAHKAIVGDVGLKAVFDRTVGINNIDEARKEAMRRGMSMADLVIEKANSLGFTPMLPYQDYLLVTTKGTVLLRCALCHEQIDSEHRICETKTVAGQYFHEMCEELTKNEDIIRLNITYGQLLEVQKDIMDRNPTCSASESYEELQRRLDVTGQEVQNAYGIYRFLQRFFVRSRKTMRA